MNSAIEKENTAVIKPECDIVASKAKEFRDELKALITAGAVELTIDLGSVEMVDSVGLGVFIAAQNSLVEVDGKLTVCNVSDDICKLFKTMRLDQHFAVTGRN
jgi:anti-anti-sigma factor